MTTASFLDRVRGTGRLEKLATLHQISRLFIRSTAGSTALAVSAMYVIEGFWFAVDAMLAPSVQKRFGTSHDWFQPLSTLLARSFPIRAVPIS